MNCDSKDYCLYAWICVWSGCLAEAQEWTFFLVPDVPHIHGAILLPLPGSHKNTGEPVHLCAILLSVIQGVTLFFQRAGQERTA